MPATCNAQRAARGIHIQHVTTTALAEQFREFGAAVPASPLKCLGERAAFAYATSLTTHTFRQVRVRLRVRVRVTPRLCVRARVQLIHALPSCMLHVTWRVVFRILRGVLFHACTVACCLLHATWRVFFRMPRGVLSFVYHMGCCLSHATSRVVVFAVGDR